MKGSRFSHKAAFAVWTLFLSLVCLMAVTFAMYPAFAQDFGSATPVLGASTNAPQLQTSSESISDLLIGKNIKGPYLLTWKQIETESEAIVIDGIIAQRGADYSVDYATGMVAFVKPLRTGSMARVQYRCQIGKAVRNAAGISLPIELNLMSKSSSSLRFTGLYKESNPNQPNTAMTVFGLSGDRNWGAGTKISSMFLVSDKQNAAEAGDGLWDRSGLKLSGSHNSGRAQVATSYQRSGEGFAGNKEYGLKTGSEVINVAAAYAASDRMLFSNSYTRELDIAGQDKGGSATAMEQKVAYNYAPGSSVTASHKVNETEAASGSDQTLNATRIEAKHVISSTKAAVASVTTSSLQGSTPQSGKEDTTVDFQYQSAGKLDVKGSHTESSSESLGDASATKFAVSANPSATMKVDADFNAASSTLAGEQTNTGVRIEASPNSYMTVKAQVREQESSILGDESLRGLRVEAKPTEAITVSAGVTEKQTSTIDDVTKEARVDIRPGSWFTVAGGVKLQELGDNVSTITDVRATVMPSKLVSLSGVYKDREMADPTASVDTMGLDLALNATGKLKILGSYQRNPEDAATGQPKAMDSTTLGVETIVGTVSLTGGYSTKTDYSLGSLSSETQLGLGFRLFGNGRITGGYKLAEAYTGSDFRTETFSLGYSHNIGSDFNLMLTGSMTKAEQDQMLLNERPEYQAEAKLGLRF
ncbi:MAG: hypothetical protein Q7N50_05035 [Armatimonadota bacterium]|nr:hypothetical protein [Armatimonadota bacterium]